MHLKKYFKDVSCFYNISWFSILIFPPLFFVLKKFNQTVNTQYLETHITELSLTSTKAQVFAYASLLALIFIRALAYLFYDSNERPNKEKHNKNAYLIISLLIFYLFLFSSASRIQQVGAVIGLIAYYIICETNFFEKFKLKILIYFLFFIYFLVYFILPIATPLVFWQVADLIWTDSHYSLTVLPAFDLTCCNDGAKLERSNYGTLVPILIAASLKMLSIFNIEAGHALITSVRLYQVIAALLVILIIRVLNSKYYLQLSLLCLLLSHNLSSLGDAVYFPNQAGVRYIGFLLGILAFVIFLSRKRTTLIAGFLAGLLFSLSPETGMPVILGYAAYHFYTAYLPNSSIADSLKNTLIYFSVVGAVAGVSLYFLVPRFYVTGTDPFFFIKLFGSGYGGLADKLSPFAAVLIFVAASFLSNSVISLKNNTATTITAYQAGMSTMILAWLPYYINRISDWNLWFQTILLILLIAPNFSIQSLKFDRSRLTVINFSYALTAIISFSLLASSVWKIYEDTSKYGLMQKNKCELMSQKYYCFNQANEETTENVRSMETHFSTLAQIQNKSDYIVLTLFSMNARLLGFNHSFPWHEPYGEIPRQIDMEIIVSHINRSGVRYLIAEDPNASIAKNMSNRTRHISRIIIESRNYAKVRADGAWVIYEKIN
jgi:hypothetical protein